jgi:phenylalanyl-tRNA synthetase beta chain
MAAIILTGKESPMHWSSKGREVDFFDLKGMIEQICPGHFEPSHHPFFHPHAQADLCVGSVAIGSLGEIHPDLLKRFGIEQRVYYAELNSTHLIALQKAQLCVKETPQYPASDRDWTVPLPLKMPIDQLLRSIDEIQSPLLEQVELIDLYTPEMASQKNATIRFTYRDRSKTLSFEEVENEHAKIIERATKSLAN